MSTDFQAIIDEIYRLFANAGVKLLYALIVLIIGLQLIKMSGKWLKKSRLVKRMDPSVASFFTSFIRVLLYILLILGLVEIPDLPTAGFITVLASCSVAIGLSLQGALSNFAGALILLFFKPFKVGDFIEAGGYSGIVSSITVFYTYIQTLDNKKIVLPNGMLTSAALTNYSAEKYRRVDLTFSASYDSNIDMVKDVIMEVIKSDPLALTDDTAPEPPLVRMSKLESSSMTYTVKVWCNVSDYWNLYFNLNENVKNAFDKNGIEIPYNQIVVHSAK